MRSLLIYYAIKPALWASRWPRAYDLRNEIYGKIHYAIFVPPQSRLTYGMQAINIIAVCTKRGLKPSVESFFLDVVYD